MPARVHSKRLLPLCAVLASIAACDASGGDGPTGGGGPSGPGAVADGGSGPGGAGGGDTASPALPGSVGPGLPCQADEDCVSGNRCLVPFFFGSQAYCSPPCAAESQKQDCQVMTDQDFWFEVPLAHPSGTGNNVWNSSSLSRGNTCVTPKGSTTSYCVWACPESSAMSFGPDGVPVSCACLPHFRFNADVTGCEWDETTECAWLERSDGPRPCNACNSDSIGGCHTGEFRCLLANNALEGDCVEWADIDQLQQCIDQGMHYNCSDGCLDGCISGLTCTAEYCASADHCYDACCQVAHGAADPATGSCEGQSGGGGGESADAGSAEPPGPEPDAEDR